ncbi:competence type IV pilus ATPase ComGA [Dellaglioa sp. P0083]|uniref:competence type IV pilus ATPase ComGA n=1 Tax=Dellaglioa kimchii TaxID=3344667 RepID=UPI0038D394E7
MIETEIQEMIKICVKNRASDMYIIPSDKGCLVKYRTLNNYHNLNSYSEKKMIQMNNFLKFKANMILSETRRPQFGTFQWQIEHEKVNCRISSVGDFLGRESIVIRFIYSNTDVPLLQLLPNQFQQLINACGSGGLILFSGPMGSGKTTTMYQLAEMIQNQRTILTIEDPVEIQNPNFIQLQVNDKANMTYAELLKVGLRHHPDIFIIGEIRDEVTANAAIKAAMSGHLILSTVHARNAVGTIKRLENLGVSRDDLNRTLQAVSYQRLIETTQGGSGVLFDILAGQKLESVLEGTFNQKIVLERWHDSLDQCIKKNIITIETANNFK